MFLTNPFYILSESVAPIFMQIFVILMIALIVLGTVMDIVHKKNVKYFFDNAKKAETTTNGFQVSNGNLDIFNNQS